MRYFLMAVAIGAVLGCGWLTASMLFSDNDFLADLAVWAAMVGLAMAVAAVGLIMRKSWGAYLLGVAAFVSVLPIGFLLLLMASTWRTQPDTTPDPLGPTLWGALILAVTVGGFGVSLGRSMARERSAPGNRPARH